MPNAADEIADILWHSVVSVYFDSFPYAPCNCSFNSAAGSELNRILINH